MEVKADDRLNQIDKQAERPQLRANNGFSAKGNIEALQTVACY